MAQIILPQERDPIKRIRQLVDNLNRISELTPEIDVSGVSYLSPLTILPLAARICSHGQYHPQIVADSTRPRDLLKSICFPHGIDGLSPRDNFIFPICRVFLDGRNGTNPIESLNQVTQIFSNSVSELLEARGEVSANYLAAIAYFLSEISDNVHQHSDAESCWIQYRFWKPRGELELCIVDDGIGIKRRYDKCGMGTQDHVDALEQAVRGISSKAVDRGYGIGSMIKLFTSDEVQGEVTILSGNACYFKSCERDPKLGIIPTFWKGLIFSVRLKRPTNRISVIPYVSG